MHYAFRPVFLVIVCAIMAVSALIAGSTTARFASNLGVNVFLGWLVGVAFDGLKGVALLVAADLLRSRYYGRASAAVVAAVFVILYSALATHGTIRFVFDQSARAGQWSEETRANTSRELDQVTREHDDLIKGGSPRPSAVVARFIESEQLPNRIWASAAECKALQDSNYLRRACNKVVSLRQELVLSLAVEKLKSRASELRSKLEQRPPAATSDAMSTSFDDTLGNLVPIAGSKGVASLLTLLLEIISCCGLWLVDGLNKPRRRELAVSADEAAPTLKPVQSARTPNPTLSQRTRANRPACVADFVREKAHVDPNGSTAAADIQIAVSRWCEACDVASPSPQVVSAELRALGFTRWKSNGRNRYAGIVLLDEQSPPMRTFKLAS